MIFQKTKIILSFKYKYLTYSRRPQNNPVFMQKYQNSNFILGALGIVYRDYYKDYFINRFGVTEDVPIGGFFNITGGFENREISDRIRRP